MLYCLVLEDTTDGRKARQRLDEELVGFVVPARETWGLLPSHQARMSRAANMGQGATPGGGDR